jgi:hypothetical protein
MKHNPNAKHKWASYLREFAVLDVLLPVEEPIRDLVLSRVGHNCDQFLDLNVSW